MQRKLLSILVVAAMAGAAIYAATFGGRTPAGPEAAEAQTTGAPPRVPLAADPFPVRRCMNMGASLERPVNPNGWGYEVDARHFAKVRAAGFDAVRLPVNWEVWQSTMPPYRIDPGFVTKVQTAVDAALAQGLTVVLNAHWHAPMMSNPAAEQPRFRASWQQIAATFEGYPDALIFELFNEPHENYKDAALSRSITEVMADVRRTHPNRWLVIPTEEWSSWSTINRLTPPPGQRIVVGVHDYDPFNFTHQGAEWFQGAPPIGESCCSDADRRDARERAANIAQWRARHGVPVYLGEFGAYDHAALTDRAAYYRMQRDAYEAQGIGWCAWGFAGGFNAYDLAQDAWIPEIRAALLGG
jgi:endoglucanase